MVSLKRRYQNLISPSKNEHNLFTSFSPLPEFIKYLLIELEVSDDAFVLPLKIEHKVWLVSISVSVNRSITEWPILFSGLYPFRGGFFIAWGSVPLTNSDL